MINIDWLEPSVWEKLKLTKLDATKKFENLREDDLLPKKLTQASKDLRVALVEAIRTAQTPLCENNSTPDLYDIDLYTGLAIYEVLNENFGFNERLASQDDIWRYLSIVIIPEVVYKRHGLKAGRYYENPRRIWLKSLWWYIHLSWQNTRKLTFDVLKNNTTDTVAQLVERTGINGYRVDFTRELMSVFHYDYLDVVGTQRTILFRRVLKLSTARTKIIEPSLVEGGINTYVKGLFEYFVKTKVKM
ncbi:hypothetical protein [Cytobacillus gottheilii]|uniref:hypothetical protein n=1 Tax=Cytobacillus gottheilii TaxID=859144 RepID=UPI0009BAAFAD|nr:hypothetical protein [Cytobacillus gottheilii]